ncbi:MAG: type VI secretion system protein VasJ [Bacteriovoracaceae bacterium]|jgi:type VI secretion system protein VasJ|tara:strand:+ start:18623 stop:20032 length:1410 start_codon:yes stop_codon:yes gene_type:complete
MNTSSIRNVINKPISVDNPVGASSVNDPLYDFVEDQMMKVGSLAHGSVQWLKVEEVLISLFNEKTKDIKLLTYLLQCFHNKNTPQSFSLSIFVLADFISEYWKACYPVAGKKGNLPRRKFFSQIIQRFGLALDKLNFSQFSEEERDELNLATSYWEKVLQENTLNSDSVDTILEAIKRKLKNSKPKIEVINEHDDSNYDVTPINPPPPTSNILVSVDNSSLKATKKTLLKVADFLFEQEDSIDLAIRMRRYAVWSPIESLPDHSNSKTLISALPEERIKEYWGLFQRPNLDLWKRVEQTLTLAPYWFDGQYLSYQIAEKLGHHRCAQAILAETQNFLLRLPNLYQFTFKGGEPFVSDTCLSWLERIDDSVMKVENGESWQERKNKVAVLVETDGIGAALSMINDGLSKSIEPRDNFYWRLISTELMQENKLNDLAQQQFQHLSSQLESMSVSEWEPSLLKRLKKHTTVK